MAQENTQHNLNKKTAQKKNFLFKSGSLSAIATTSTKGVDYQEKPSGLFDNYLSQNRINADSASDLGVFHKDNLDLLI
jgi:hypothetical protein